MNKPFVRIKKLSALLLALIMLLSAAPVLARAAWEGARASYEARDRERALTALMELSSRLSDMRKRFAPKASELDADDPFTTARIIVKASSEPEHDKALACVSGYNDWYFIQYADRDTAEEECRRLEKTEGVEYAEPDMLMHADSVADGMNYHSWGYTPENVSAAAYNDRIYAYYAASGLQMPAVRVAVIDTGIDASHPFFKNRLLPGYDFSNDDADPDDDHHHGTHVSGIVVDGTLSNVKIVPVKVLDHTGYGDTSTVALGIEFSCLVGCEVANLSLGDYCDGLEGEDHMMMYESINNAMDAGTVVVVSAGNERTDAANYCPANVERAVTVAAMNSDHTLAAYSNYGDTVDVLAPGTLVSSSVPGGGFEMLSGTSMAAPHVSAVAAMIKTYAPAMSADDVAEEIASATVDVGVANAGSGMICAAEIFPEFPEFLFGDADLNGVVTANDALLILRYNLGVVDVNRIELRVCDINGDGAVTANDALAVLRHSLGIAPLPERGGE